MRAKALSRYCFRMCRLALVLPLALAALPWSARAQTRGEEGRRISSQHLAVALERFELPNGLVVLLSPDPDTSSALVWMTFRAGALFEPSGRSGMAHLVEHVMATGPTPDTDYARLLTERRARYFNASTSADTLSFETIVPAEELPAALWVQADRLGTLPDLIDDALVERHRRVVEQERAFRSIDEPYGLVDELVLGKLFARPHPLHGGVIGIPAELSQVTAEDVRAFVRERLVPANAVLTVVGRFDPAEARRLAERELGRLPAGQRAPSPALPPFAEGVVAKKLEPISRQPRVTLAWRFPSLPSDHAAALQLGAQMLTLSTDGAWGMRLSAGFAQHDGESLFRLDLMLPYDETIDSTQKDADGFLRSLTLREMPVDFFAAANLALERAALFSLDSLAARAHLLTRLELLFGGAQSAQALLEQHWKLPADTVRDVARVYLKRPRVVIHARPSRPRPAREERE